MYDEFMGGGISIFFEVSVVFSYRVTHYASRRRRGLSRSLEFSPIHQVRPGHRQHFPSASLLRCVDRFTKEPAPQLVPPDWASASLSLLLRFPRHVPGVDLSRRLSFW